MNLAEAPPIKAVVFTLAIVLGVVGVVLYAANAHQGASKVDIPPVQSDSPSSPAPTGSPPSSSPAIVNPDPVKLGIGPTICSDTDYTVGVTKNVQSVHVTSYDVTASYTGKKGGKCLLIEYPLITVASFEGRDTRELHPSGGVVNGFGQPVQVGISDTSDAYSFLRVTGKTCNSPTLQNVQLDRRLLIATKLAKWCRLDESYWTDRTKKLDRNTKTGCRPYDLGVSRVTTKELAHVTRYMFTVTNKKPVTNTDKPSDPCALNEFPHLTAETAAGERRELKPIHAPTSTPSYDLFPGGVATAYIDVPTTCPGGALNKLRVENLDLVKKGSKPLNIRNCSVTEAYWTPKA